MDYNIIYVTKQALMLSLLLSLPVVAGSAIVGLIFSVFQALTQIQDQTLSFAIKLVFIILLIYLTIDWMALKIFHYALILFQMMG